MHTIVCTEYHGIVAGGVLTRRRLTVVLLVAICITYAGGSAHDSSIIIVCQ